jgi:hypothetical protein
MDNLLFTRRAQTFGFDDTPWANDALRLLYNVPRAFLPLVQAWNYHYPSTRLAMRRLVSLGFVKFQAPLIVDTLSGNSMECVSKVVNRFIITASGRRLLDAVDTDSRVLEDTFFKTTTTNLTKIHNILELCNLEASHAKFGVSATTIIEKNSLSVRTGHWWIARLIALGYIRKLEKKYADTRAVIPAHYRVTRELSKQLLDVSKAFPMAAFMPVEFRLERSRYLDDIDPVRIGISGATDFDHDVEAQRVLSNILYSPACVTESKVLVEPRYFLPLYKSNNPWKFSSEAPSSMFYQPDLEFKERDKSGQLSRCVVEYERYQSRRDGWNHIERFLGYVHTKTLPVESVCLRFVVDSPFRVQAYRELIEAFADWSNDYPNLMPSNNTVLAVSSVDTMSTALDPLEDHNWFKITLASPTGDPTVVVHPTNTSPYLGYFSR